MLCNLQYANIFQLVKELDIAWCASIPVRLMNQVYRCFFPCRNQPCGRRVNAKHIRRPFTDWTTSVFWGPNGQIRCEVCCAMPCESKQTSWRVVGLWTYARRPGLWQRIRSL